LPDFATAVCPRKNGFVFAVFIRRVGRTDNSLPNEFTYCDDENDVIIKIHSNFNSANANYKSGTK